MKTVHDAKQLIMGPGGAVVRSMPDVVKAPFVQKALELGHQIAADNNVDFETGDVPDDTPLSDAAMARFQELQSITNTLLLRSMVA